ncbi:hypothetical protein [Haliscomenobacter hydrossis]|uniref:Uncharacterized protein n=1 Tax=Haliscomenobacter hydrossis (strain ATCC 27775 / DSM 1100 / LMG 10767 / O) TaxID=760192 RepID=F4L1M4_HALH1|nr:hypothetical protein [Haliscomenobacter hydrossis]AEE48568.1 hypothetical protein Halhy_0660 [Haliscomenobacter hydrossis DSM 1100]
MYFLLDTVSVARGAQVTPAQLAYSAVLLSSAVGAFFMARQIEGLSFYILVPLLALFLVWKIPDLSSGLQTGLGLFTVAVACFLLLIILNPRENSYSIQGTSIDEWNKFRAFVVALPCMCIMLRIVSYNPSKLNLILFGLPLVVCAGFSVYALRILLA